MKRSLAEAYDIAHLCPLCMFTGSENTVIKHMIDEHTDEEMINATGWKMEEFEDEDEV